MTGNLSNFLAIIPPAAGASTALARGGPSDRSPMASHFENELRAEQQADVYPACLISVFCRDEKPLLRSGGAEMEMRTRNVGKS